MQNYYELLDISKDATPQEVKRSYFKQIKIYSPEKDAEQFQKIRKAYEVLSDVQARQTYDEGFQVDKPYQNELLMANEFLRKHNGTKALQILKKIDKAYPNDLVIQLGMSKAHLCNNSTGTAVTLLQKLYSEHPKNEEVALALAIAYKERGYNTKAGQQFEQALSLNNKNEDAWAEYIRYFISEDDRDSALELYEKAMAVDQNMLLKNYELYIFAINQIIRDKKNDQKLKVYVTKFVEGFLLKPNATQEEYDQMVNAAVPLSTIGVDNVFEKLLPLLQNSPYNGETYEEEFAKIEQNIDFNNFRKDKKVLDVFKELTDVLRKKCSCKECLAGRLDMECYIIENMKTIGKDVTYLRTQYPEYYKLNADFYSKILNPSKENELKDQYYKKLMTLRKKGFSKGKDMTKALSNLTEDEQVVLEALMEMAKTNPFEDDNRENQETYVRNTLKVGRNDPCPCGSGKKYKKCCGA